MNNITWPSSKAVQVRICSASLYLLTILFAYSTAASGEVVDSKTIRCVTPLADYDLSLLEELAFYGESSIPKIARTSKNFSIECSSGRILPMEGVTLKFHENGVVKSAVVGVSQELIQDEALLSLPRGAEVKFTEQGLIRSAHDVGPSLVRVANQDWPIADSVKFDMSGAFYSGEVSTDAPVAVMYFGEEYFLDNNDMIVKTRVGNIFPAKAHPSLIGHWTLENRQGNLKIRVAGDGEGEYKIFLLKGDPSVLKASMRDELLRAGVAITEPFFLSAHSSTNINLMGIEDVPNPNGEGMVSERVISQAELEVREDQLVLTSSSINALSFTRDSWLQTAGNILKALFQGSIALLFFLSFSLVGLYGLRRQSSVLANARFDRRYRNGRLRGGGTIQGIFIVAAIWLGVSLFGYYWALNYFRIGGLFDFISFFLY